MVEDVNGLPKRLREMRCEQCGFIMEPHFVNYRYTAPNDKYHRAGLTVKGGFFRAKHFFVQMSCRNAHCEDFFAAPKYYELTREEANEIAEKRNEKRESAYYGTDMIKY